MIEFIIGAFNGTVGDDGVFVIHDDRPFAKSLAADLQSETDARAAIDTGYTPGYDGYAYQTLSAPNIRITRRTTPPKARY